VSKTSTCGDNSGNGVKPLRILGHPIRLDAKTLRMLSIRSDREKAAKARSTGLKMIRNAIENRKKRLPDDRHWFAKEQVLEDAGNKADAGGRCHAARCQGS